MSTRDVVANTMTVLTLAACVLGVLLLLAGLALIVQENRAKWQAAKTQTKTELTMGEDAPKVTPEGPTLLIHARNGLPYVRIESDGPTMVSMRPVVVTWGPLGAITLRVVDTNYVAVPNKEVLLRPLPQHFAP